MFGSIGAGLLFLILDFSIRVGSSFLGRFGLDMTVLAAGTCMFIVAVTQTQWRSPRFLNPLLNLGQRSYEVYLTHMFVVFGLFYIFTLAGRPMSGVPVLFMLVIFIAGLIGEVVARFYSEPMNQLIRKRFAEDATSPVFP